MAVAGLLGHLEPGVHELAGPAALTMSQVAAVLTEATGREVVYQPVTLAEFRADLLPPEAADGTAGLFAELFDGRNRQPTGGVRAALGREPRSFADAMTAALRPAGPR